MNVATLLIFVPPRDKVPDDFSLCFPLRCKAPGDFGLCFPLRGKAPDDFSLCFPLRGKARDDFSLRFPLRDKAPADFRLHFPPRGKAPVDFSPCFPPRGKAPDDSGQCFRLWEAPTRNWKYLKHHGDEAEPIHRVSGIYDFCNRGSGTIGCGTCMSHPPPPSVAEEPQEQGGVHGDGGGDLGGVDGVADGAAQEEGEDDIDGIERPDGEHVGRVHQDPELGAEAGEDAAEVVDGALAVLMEARRGAGDEHTDGGGKADGGRVGTADGQQARDEQETGDPHDEREDDVMTELVVGLADGFGDFAAPQHERQDIDADGGRGKNRSQKGDRQVIAEHGSVHSLFDDKRLAEQR